MRPLLLAAIALPSLLAAQAPRPGSWRFGIEAHIPSKLLEVNEVAFPDSNDGQIKVGIGYAAVAERFWRMKDPKARWGVVARVASAPVEGTLAGTTYKPGRALVIDAGLRVAREIQTTSEVFVGAGVSHWSGPDNTSPFSSGGSIRLAAEGGWTYRLSSVSPWRVSASAHITRFPQDDARLLATGIVWRAFAGITRDY
ncbi:MAG TPA: hypothetical protein VJR92_12580 [Gemmatimonadaceae bacterium]|nr:hypothetical protein [Gemmatimonadaceae bacterium]